MTSLAELAYQHAVQALAHQASTLDELRSRTGTLLAASAITASFLGATALDDGTLGTLDALALISFALSVIACVYVLLPRKKLVFSLSGPVVYTSLYEHADDTGELHRRLAYWLEEYYRENESVLDRLYPTFTAAAAATALQLMFWALALGATL